MEYSLYKNIFLFLFDRFHFTSEEFHNNQAYYKLSVLTTSSIYFVCPNPTTIFGVTNMSIPREELNENLWIVDKKSFETCNIDRNNTKNKLLKQCIWNSDDNRRPYRKIVFQQYSGTLSGLQFVPGHEYYFIGKEISLTIIIINPVLIWFYPGP